MHQNGDGAVTISDVAYTVGTTQNASARQTPLVWAIDHVVCGGADARHKALATTKKYAQR